MSGRHPRLPRSVRALVVVSLAVTGPVALATLAAPALTGSMRAALHAVRHPTRLGGAADLLVGLCAVATTVALFWLAACVAACALETALPRARAPRLLSPRAVRRLVAVAVGTASVVGAIPAPGWAHPAEQREAASRLSVLALVEGLHLPDRPAPAPDQARHRVVPGDTLWALAAQRTRPDPGAVAQASRWLYEANRRVVGADPDLLIPGTVLDLTVLDTLAPGDPS